MKTDGFNTLDGVKQSVVPAPTPWRDYIFPDRGYKILRMVLGGVFLWSGTVKLADIQSFAVLIGAYGIVPENLNLTAAVGLSFSEMAIALALMADIRGSLGSMAGLLVFFMIILGYGIHMGFDVDCGCFGVKDPEYKSFHGLAAALYKDVMLLGVIFYLYLYRRVSAYQPVAAKDLLTDILNKRRRT